MARYEIDAGAGPEVLGSLEQLFAAARSGRVQASSRVRLDGGPWQLASGMKELSPHLSRASSLWDAWDETVDEDPPSTEDTEDIPTDHGAAAPAVAGRPAPPRAAPAPRVQALELEELQTLASHRVVPLAPPPPIAVPPQTLHPAELKELAPDDTSPTSSGRAPIERVAPKPLPPVGKVLPFPGPKRGSALPKGRGGAQSSPRPRSKATPRRSPAPRFKTQPVLLDEPDPNRAAALERTSGQLPGRLQTRHFWMGGVVLGVAVLTSLMVVWVRGTASWTSGGARERVGQEALPPLPKPVQPQISQPTAEQGLAKVVSDLRARIPSDARALGGDVSQIEDTLFVELRRVVAIDRVQARVQGFDEQEQPLGLQLQVVLQAESAEDLSRSFSAIGLVVGKYVDRGELELGELVVQVPTDEGALEKSFDAARAAAFWRGELGAQAYLRGE